MNIQDKIEEYIKMMGSIGHPALMENFILRNGETMEVGPLVGEQGTPKECFANATNAYLENYDSTYVEGYMWRAGFPILIHHAWIEIDGKVMDNTIVDNQACQYYGVRFTRETLKRQLEQNGVYGLLDPGLINLKLMVECDPGLLDLMPECLRGNFQK